jgi:hypothetical protein
MLSREENDLLTRVGASTRPWAYRRRLPRNSQRGEQLSAQPRIATDHELYRYRSGQDGCATESMGAIYDRSKEHLGYSDKTIIALRKMLLKAVGDLAEGKEPPHIVRDSMREDFSKVRSIKGVLPAGTDWSWKGWDRMRGNGTWSSSRSKR